MTTGPDAVPDAAVGVVGVGAIAEAVVIGLCDRDPTSRRLVLSPRSRARTRRLAERFPAVAVARTNQEVLDQSEVVLLCFRPQDARDALGPLTFMERHIVVSLMATIRLAELADLVRPAHLICRAVPLPAVEHGASLTAVWPAVPAAARLFDQVGGVLAVDDESLLDAVSTATGTIAAHLAYLAEIQTWLVGQGLSRPSAARYVASVFGPVAELLKPPPDDLMQLADRHATAGGLNERFLADLQRRGFPDAVPDSLDALLTATRPPAPDD